MGVKRRAAVYAALGEPVRLAIVDDLAVTDRSPTELASQFELASNLLSHHLDVLESVGLIERFAAALWRQCTGEATRSAGTHPADGVHPGAVAAAERAGLDLGDCRPHLLGHIDDDEVVVTVCDRAHEELRPGPTWWHWSLPDPVEADTDAAFDAVVNDLDERIRALRN